MEDKFKPLKSVTFWGALIAALAHFLGSQGVIPPEAATAIESVGGVAATYGIRRRLPSQ